MDITKKPYEISLWEDILVFVVEDLDGNREEFEEFVPDYVIGKVVAQYYKEQKICVIGSDTMNSAIRAVQGKLNSKVNGENILTFNMYSHYYDSELESQIENPFVKLLINERKVKLRYGAPGAQDVQWYDLVIKNVQENSDTKTYTYTAKNQFVNELSKSGFNLQLDSQLENNMGNVNELGEFIISETDWELKPSNEILKEAIEEPLYRIVLNKTINGTNMETNEHIELQKGEEIFIFYSIIVDQNPYVQFIYEDNYETNSDYVITNASNWSIESVNYTEDGKPDFAQVMEISDEYRGKRLVRKGIAKFDSIIDKYVKVYKNYDGSEIYGYTEQEFTSPTAIVSYVTNPNNFDSTAGWSIGGVNKNGEIVFPDLEFVTVPDIRDVPSESIDEINFIPCLKLKITSPGQILYNTGIIDNRHNISSFTQGEKYVFKVKYGQAGSFSSKNRPTSLVDTDTGLNFNVAKYELNNGVYNIVDTYFHGELVSAYTGSEPDYKYVIAECQKSLTYKEMISMTKTLGLFVEPTGLENGAIYIEDLQFFKYVGTIDAVSGPPMDPGSIHEGKVETIYYYYDPSQEYKSIDDIEYLYKDYQPASYEVAYNINTFEKIRSVTASESNRFNLLQELCEIFECWIKFEVEHNLETGEILFGKDKIWYDENGIKCDCPEEQKYRQQKWISFHEFIGKENGAGFKYGINLKSIQRTLDSEGFVSKLIVKNNSNEFANNGFCSIARASESPNGENFLLDFSYYVQHGMLKMSEVTNDLYLDVNGYIGYYKLLKRINKLRDQYIEEQAGLLTDLSKYESLYQTHELAAQEAEELLKDKYVLVKTLSGLSFEQLMNDQNNTWWKNDSVLQTISSISHLKSSINNHKKLAENAKQNLDNSQKRYDWIQRALTEETETDDPNEERLLIKKEKLNKTFYQKYASFLQEGSWISEDYLDDNLYYLDATSTLHTSAQPKISYNIGVIELSQIDEYQNYVFSLGDKTTMEDTEFFGWVFKDGVQTPYQEEIIVSEITIVLDSPEQNQIKVQNYKTQFEDLFQRMAATTQAVEYSTGQYNKVSSIVKSDGTIDIVTLQNSIANNALTLQNAKDQSVIWDETGITTTSLTNPSEIVRIVSGGVFLSMDGGVTWNTGITGRGINANYITSGKINTEEVSILSGAFPSFRWNGEGLSAYEFQLNQNNEAINFNYGKFIRFDQFGIYGINGLSEFNSMQKDEDGLYGEDKIWKYSNFALTWRGFQIKSSHSDRGYVSITSDNDLQVINSAGKEQIKLGLLGEKDGVSIYGLRLTDANEKIVLEQSSEGKLWIRNEISIGSGDTSTVSIGYLSGTKASIYNNGKDFSEVPKSEIHEVINANDRFMVYEDGSMKATDGEFTGVIYATGGKIGNLEIESFPDPNYEVIIESDSGAVFKNNSEVKILVAKLYKGKEEVTQNLQYQWYKFSTLLEGENKNFLEVAASELDNSNDQATYYCAITYDSASM